MPMGIQKNMPQLDGQVMNAILPIGPKQWAMIWISQHRMNWTVILIAYLDTHV